MERHQQHAERDADPFGARRDRSRCRKHRRHIAIIDKVMLRHPYDVEAVVLGPCDLVENFSIKTVGRLTPLLRIAEVVPETETNSALISTHLLTTSSVLIMRMQFTFAFRNVIVLTILRQGKKRIAKRMSTFEASA